jgi:hypothetical protein
MHHPVYCHSTLLKSPVKIPGTGAKIFLPLDCILTLTHLNAMDESEEK